MQEEVEGNVIPLSSVPLLPVLQRVIIMNPGFKRNYFIKDQLDLKTCIYSPKNLIMTHTHGGPSKSFHFSDLHGLKEQLPAHLLLRSELPESILVFAVAHRSEVLGLPHIYYLHNCFAAHIYFSCFAPLSRTFCRGTCFLSVELDFDADANLTHDFQMIEWLLETVKRLHKDELCLWPSPFGHTRGLAREHFLCWFIWHFIICVTNVSVNKRHQTCLACGSAQVSPLLRPFFSCHQWWNQRYHKTKLSNK